MSGVLGDYLRANCKLVATADSYTGAEVRLHDLGLTLQSEDPSTVATTLVEALSLPATPVSPKACAYKERIAPASVLGWLPRLIDQSVKAREIRKSPRSVGDGVGHDAR
jgi:hypothetical protein